MFSTQFTNKEAGFSRYGLVILTILAVGVIALIVTLNTDSTPTDDPDETDNGDPVSSDLIEVESPQPGETISSPLTVSGEARGFWYFEANFSVEIVDDAGNVLVTVPVQAQGEWMTEEFVPFSESITFDMTEAQTETGLVIFHRANPSGLPENADSVEVPVTFTDANGDGGTTTVNVFWSDEAAAVAGDCSVVESFERAVPETEAVATAALNELLAGPTQAEIESGFVTNIPEDVELLSVAVEDNVAYADFSAELNQVGGSCRVGAIYTQISETLLQFSTVDDVVISVEGETEEVLQP